MLVLPSLCWKKDLVTLFGFGICSEGFCAWTLQLNIGQETLRGLMANWMARRRQRTSVISATANGDVESGVGEHRSDHRPPTDDSHDDVINIHQPSVLPAFEFSNSSPPSIITEGSQVFCT